MKIKNSEIDKNSSGVFIDRINNDTNSMITIFDSLISYFLDFISNLGILIAILYISFPMFIYFVITSIISSFVSNRKVNKMFSQSKKYRKIKEKKTGLISELVRGVKDVKLLNAEEGMLKKTRTELNKVNKEYYLLNKTSRKYSFLSNNIRDIFDFTFIAFGSFLIHSNMLSIANFVVLYTYRHRIEGLLGVYERIIDLLGDYNLGASRVFEILESGFEKERTNGEKIDNINGNIEFKNVSFSYGEGEVLKNVSFSIKKGERIGFVGESGCGKSTIFNLIVGLYDYEKGKILIDDKNIKNISLESIRKNISLIQQSPYIFNFSIKDNLLLGNVNATDDEIIEACKKAEIYDRIMEFDEKFDTVVGEGGVTLSGGERQRLAIARCLIKNTNIILFDEATSSLDNITQDKIQKAIYGLDKDKTVLIIAHRLSTVVNCDKIIVIDDGQIIDIGSHKELLKRCNKYKDLYKFEKSKNN